jgi:para-nitrobenzyl esterase
MSRRPMTAETAGSMLFIAALATCAPAADRGASGDDAASTRQTAEMAATSTSVLEGTSWQLVQFQGMDDSTLTPDDGTKYTLSFEPDGVLVARIDCNRGRGTWSVDEPSGLELGPLAITRAACPPGSLHDQILRQWAYIRSFVLEDGHLYLALMADGGIYEFEPAEEG